MKVSFFVSSQYVCIDDISFTKLCKYVVVNPNKNERDQWNQAIEKGDECYNNETHILCIDNCHSHRAFMINFF